jgi:coenzyme F420-reducing hydrogenase alpha subunit
VADEGGQHGDLRGRRVGETIIRTWGGRDDHTVMVTWGGRDDHTVMVAWGRSHVSPDNL